MPQPALVSRSHERYALGTTMEWPEVFVLVVGTAASAAAGASAAAWWWRKRYSALRRSMTGMIGKLEADLDDRRGIERELAHIASFAEVAPNPIIETDLTGAVYYTNPAALERFPSLEKKLVPDMLSAGLEDVVASLKRSGSSLTTRAIPVGDRIYDEQVALLDGGPRIRLYLSDITEMKRLEQLKTDFVNMVSHELRSPLTAMNASLRLVESGVIGDLTGEQKQALALALRSVDRLARMINELLDVSKIEAGKYELQRTAFDLRDAVRETAEVFVALGAERKIAVRSRLPEAPLRISADRDKIVEVITNLMQNALKFTSQGAVEAILENRFGEAVVIIQDTGPGIPPEALPRVFGKFQQLGTRSSSGERGTGLGLSLCKGIIDLHGGKIWVESRVGEGSRFCFSLPADPDA